MKVIGLENEMEKLKVVNEIHTTYIDTKKKLNEIESFARKISSSDLRESDVVGLLKQLEEYRHKIMQQSGLEKTREQKPIIKNDPKAGINYSDIMNFLAGFSSVPAAHMFKKIYSVYKEERIEDVVNLIYGKILEIENEVDENE